MSGITQIEVINVVGTIARVKYWNNEKKYSANFVRIPWKLHL